LETRIANQLRTSFQLVRLVGCGLNLMPISSVKILECWSYQVQKEYRFDGKINPFWYNTGSWQTDGQTDRQTDRRTDTFQ